MALVAKKGTTTSSTTTIWQFFGFRPDESGQPRDTTEVVCKICSCVIRAKDRISRSQACCFTVHFLQPHSLATWRCVIWLEIGDQIAED